MIRELNARARLSADRPYKDEMREWIKQRVGNAPGVPIEILAVALDEHRYTVCIQYTDEHGERRTLDAPEQFTMRCSSCAHSFGSHRGDAPHACVACSCGAFVNAS